MIKSFAAVHLCYPATSVGLLMRWALQKFLMHQQNKMLGTDPILFSDLLDGLFLLNGVLPPPHSLGTKTTSPHAESSLCHKTAAAFSCRMQVAAFSCGVETISWCWWGCAGLWQGVPANRGRSARKACGRSVVAGTLDL